MNNKRGVTLVELLLVVGLILVLAAASLIFLNPGSNFRKTFRNKSYNEARLLSDAIAQYTLDSGDTLPPSLNGNPYLTAYPGIEISTDGMDICSWLVPKYIAGLPVYSEFGSPTPITNCAVNYSTNYYIFRRPNSNDVFIRSIAAPTPTISP